MAAEELLHKSGVKVMILIFPNQHVKVDMLSEVSNTRRVKDGVLQMGVPFLHLGAT